MSLTFQTRDQSLDEVRMVEVLIEQLRKIGIDARMQRVNDATLQEHHFTGDFEAMVRSSACGSVNEPWFTLNQFSSANAAPVGKSGSTNLPRWSGPDYDRYNELVSELGTLPLNDPKVAELTDEAYALWFNDRVSFPVVEAKFLLGFNQTYWKNWPTTENNYMQPAYWWAGWVRSLVELAPAEN